MPGGERALTPALVAQLASHSRTYSIFALVDALGDPGAHKRLAALDHLLDLGEPPPKILGMLARQFRLLIRLKEGAGAAPGNWPQPNVPQWKVKSLAQQAARFQRPPSRPPGSAAPGGPAPEDQHRQPAPVAGVGLAEDGAGVS